MLIGHLCIFFGEMLSPFFIQKEKRKGRRKEERKEGRKEAGYWFIMDSWIVNGGESCHYPVTVVTLRDSEFHVCLTPQYFQVFINFNHMFCTFAWLLNLYFSFSVLNTQLPFLLTIIIFKSLYLNKQISNYDQRRNIMIFVTFVLWWIGFESSCMFVKITFHQLQIWQKVEPVVFYAFKSETNKSRQNAS